MEVACRNQRQKRTQRPIGIRPERRELVERRGCCWIGAQEGCNLLGARFLNAQIGSAQSRVTRLELVANLLPGKRLRGRDTRQAKSQNQPAYSGGNLAKTGWINSRNSYLLAGSKSAS
jgi:hypothetical protein